MDKLQHISNLKRRIISKIVVYEKAMNNFTKMKEISPYHLIPLALCRFLLRRPVSMVSHTLNERGEGHLGRTAILLLILVSRRGNDDALLEDRRPVPAHVLV